MFLVPAGATCRVRKNTEGRTDDWHLLSEPLAPRAGAPKILDDKVQPTHSLVALPFASTDRDIWLRLPA
eukprot:361558-Pyramimonas_sp.AAC.1